MDSSIDAPWLHIDSCHDKNGQSPTQGLFVVGRKWLSCRASELIMGVERDVDHVMTLVERELLKHQEVEA
jgi:putative flavoprotein involved in K+ transport